MVLLGLWSLAGCTECPDPTADRCAVDADTPASPAPAPTPTDARITETLAIPRPRVDVLVVVDTAHPRSDDLSPALHEALGGLADWARLHDLDVQYGLVDSLGGQEPRALGLLDVTTPDVSVLLEHYDTLPIAGDSGFVRSAIYRALALQADANGDFRRDDASLEVLVASPRDDRSVAPEPTEFVSWLRNHSHRSGRAHAFVPPEADTTLDFVVESGGQHAWPFYVEPPPDWRDDKSEPWAPPPVAFDLENLVARNAPPRLYLAAPPADPSTIQVQIERSTPDGPVFFGALVCTEPSESADCYLVYERERHALDWVQRPPDDAVAAHLTYTRRDATP
jgi:hypothetical protein